MLDARDLLKTGGFGDLAAYSVVKRGRSSERIRIKSGTNTDSACICPAVTESDTDNVRVGESNYLFAAAFGVITWLGLYLRDARIRNLMPRRRLAA